MTLEIPKFLGILGSALTLVCIAFSYFANMEKLKGKKNLQALLCLLLIVAINATLIYQAWLEGWSRAAFYPTAGIESAFGLVAAVIAVLSNRVR